MRDEEKTREQLLEELASLRQRRATLQRSEVERKRTKEALRRAQEELEARVRERTAELTRANESLQDDRRIMDSGESEELEELVGDRAFLSMKTPYRDGQGNIVGLIGVARDITELKRAEERIRQLKAEIEQRVQELQRSNEELEQFAYMASHDLQEPLRMVSSFSQLLARLYKAKLVADAGDFISYA